MIVMDGKLTVGGGICCVYPVGGGAVTVNGKALGLEPGGLAVMHLRNSERAEIETPKAIVCKISV